MRRTSLPLPPRAALLALDIARLALREVSVPRVVECLPERVGDAVGVLLVGEDRVLAVQVIKVVDVIPPVGGGVRRGALVVVQNQPCLSPHAVMYRHLPLLCSDMVSTES